MPLDIDVIGRNIDFVMIDIGKHESKQQLSPGRYPPRGVKLSDINHVHSGRSACFDS